MATARVVTVHVASVQGLQQDDPNVFADPYLALTVGKHSRKSSVKRKTQDPCFDETFDFYPDDTASASLQVQVLDKARAKESNLISECTVPLAEALLEAQEQPLTRQLSPTGTLVFRLSEADVPAHLIANGKLVVLLIGADGLPAADIGASDGVSSGLADPYARITCGGLMRRSRVVEQSLQPRWSEEISPLPEPQLAQKVAPTPTLTLTRWDEEISFVGRLRELQANGLLVKLCDRDSGAPPPGARST